MNDTNYVQLPPPNEFGPYEQESLHINNSLLRVLLS